VPFFLLLFVAVPVVELVVLIKVGAMIGALQTVALVFLTAILGAWLLKQQGMATLTRARQRMNSGELPAQEVAEGLILAAGGAMLLTPGFMTDLFGFTCLLPFTRQWLVGQAIKRLTIAGSAGGFSFSRPIRSRLAVSRARSGAKNRLTATPTATSLKASIVTKLKPATVASTKSKNFS